MKETLINNFLRISKIPRESGHEEKIADFFINIAKKNGNINSKPIALQAHLDMETTDNKIKIDYLLIKFLEIIDK